MVRIRIALLRSGDVEPDPGPPQARSRGGGGEFLCVDISAEIAANSRRVFDIFNIFLVVARAVCCVHMDFSWLSRLSRDTWNELLGSSNCHLVVQELGSLFCVVLFSLQFFSARHLLCVFRGDCINLGFSQYHQSPVRLDFKHALVAAVLFSQSMGSRLAVLEYGRVESPPSVNFDPDIPSQETADACLWELTHGILLEDTCVLNSTGMIFRLEECKLWRELQVETWVVVATREATVKYRTTSTRIALSWIS